MFPGNESQFGGAAGAGGPFGGSGDFGPPPADGIFESAFEEIESAAEENQAINAEREHDFLAVGLHFFEDMKRM